MVQLPEDVRLSELESTLESTTFQILDRISPNHGFTSKDIWFEELRFPDRGPDRYVRYNFHRCVRLQLNWREFEIVGDYSDPVAQARNRAVHQAAQEALATVTQTDAAMQ